MGFESFESKTHVRTGGENDGGKLVDGEMATSGVFEVESTEVEKETQ